MQGARREHPRFGAVTDEQRRSRPGAAPPRRAGAISLSGFVSPQSQSPGYAPSSCLARKRNRLQQNRNLFLHRPLGCFNVRLRKGRGSSLKAAVRMVFGSWPRSAGGLQSMRRRSSAALPSTGSWAECRSEWNRTFSRMALARQASPHRRWLRIAGGLEFPLDAAREPGVLAVPMQFLSLRLLCWRL